MRFDTLKKTTAIYCTWAVLLLAAGTHSCETLASDWIPNANGNWSGAGNWSGGVPNGIDAEANFSNVDITADRTVTNDGMGRTVGSLIFGDLNTGTPANWILAGSSSNPLTLQTSTAAPEIRVDTATATINATLLGNQGFTKTGAGKLILGVNGPVLRGGITVANGELSSPNNMNTNTFGNNALHVGNTATLRVYTQTGSSTIATREISGSGVLATNVVSGSPNTTLRPFVLNDATFSGSAEGASKFIINTAGPGNWTLTGSFASNVTSVAAGNGTLTLAGSASFNRSDATPFTGANLASFGTLVLDNASTTNSNRYLDSASLTLNGGQLRLIGNGSSSITETAGVLTSSAGSASTIEVVRSTQNVTLNFGSYSLNGAVNIVGTGGMLGSNIKVLAGTLAAGGEGSGASRLERRVFVNGTDFAKYDDINGFTPYTAYSIGSLNSATGAAAALVDSAQTLTGSRAAAALKIDGAQNIDLTTFSLTVGSNNVNTSGMILKTGAGTATISGSSGSQLTIGASTREYQVRVDEGQLNITAAVNMPGNTRFVKSGQGVLHLNPTTVDASLDATDSIVFAEGVIRMNPNSATLSGPVRVFNGGIMEITGTATYSPTIGNSASGVVLTNGGGFAAFGGDVTITTPITWAVSNSIGDGKPLLLNSTTADSAIELSGTLNLIGANTALQYREIRVADNPNSTADKAVISGQIISLTGSLNTVNQSHLLKTGSGLLELTHNDNQYMSETIVQEGRLNVNGTLSALAAPAHGTVTAIDGATLGGTGVINRPVVAESGSFIAPGTSPGSLELGSSFDLQAGATLQIELGGTIFDLNVNEEYDRLIVAGPTNLAGDLEVTLINSFELDADQFFGILDGDGGITGTFDNFADGDTILSSNGFDLLISYQGLISDSGIPSITGGNDVVLYTLSNNNVPVPEPNTLVLLLVSAAIGWICRKRFA